LRILLARDFSILRFNAIGRGAVMTPTKAVQPDPIEAITQFRDQLEPGVNPSSCQFLLNQ
jgi:hypothetical protein